MFRSHIFPCMKCASRVWGGWEVWSQKALVSSGLLSLPLSKMSLYIAMFPVSSCFTSATINTVLLNFLAVHFHLLLYEELATPDMKLEFTIYCFMFNCLTNISKHSNSLISGTRTVRNDLPRHVLIPVYNIYIYQSIYRH